MFDFGENIFKEKKNKINMARSASTTVMKRSKCHSHGNAVKKHKHSKA